MVLEVENLSLRERIWRIMARFGMPLDKNALDYLKEEGLGDGATRAIGCLGWIWTQWLLETPGPTILKEVQIFVDRGLEMQKVSRKFYERPLNDVYLLC